MTLGVEESNISVASGVSNDALQACIDDDQDKTMSEKSSHTAPQSPHSASETPHAPAQSNTVVKEKSKLSKTAVLALLVALGAGAGSGYLYWQYHLQQSAQPQVSVAQVEQLVSNNARLSQQVSELQNAVNTLKAYQTQASEAQKMQAQEWQQTLKANQQAVGAQIEHAIAASQANKQPPLDMNEVKRLVSLADFKIWSERNYAGARSVLQRLDALLASYPGNARLRSAVHADLQQLSAVEVADVESLVLTLHGLSQQIDKLHFNMVQLPDEQVQAQGEPLSENVSDWRANLSRSWDQLVDDFIKVRQRQSAVEPLLDNKQQRIITARIHFYLDQASFAATHGYSDLYKTSLQSASDLVTQFYDFEQAQTEQFLSQLKQLKLAQLKPVNKVTLATVRALEES